MAHQRASLLAFVSVLFCLPSSSFVGGRHLASPHATTSAWLLGSGIVVGNVTGVERGASGSVEVLFSTSCNKVDAEPPKLKVAVSLDQDRKLHTALWVADGTGLAAWEISMLPPSAVFSSSSLMTKVYRVRS